MDNNSNDAPIECKYDGGSCDCTPDITITSITSSTNIQNNMCTDKYLHDSTLNPSIMISTKAIDITQPTFNKLPETLSLELGRSLKSRSTADSIPIITGYVKSLDLSKINGNTPTIKHLFIGPGIYAIDSIIKNALVKKLNMNLLPKLMQSITSIGPPNTEVGGTQPSFKAMLQDNSFAKICKGLAETLILVANESNSSYDYTTFFYGLESLDLSQVTTTTIDTLVNGSTYPTTLQSITMPTSLSTLSPKLPPTLTNIDLSLTKITELDFDFSSFKDLTTLKLPQTLTAFSSNLENTPLSSLNVLNTSTRKSDDLPTTLTNFTATLGGTKITKLSFAGGSLNNFVPVSLPETLTCLDLSLITSC